MSLIYKMQERIKFLEKVREEGVRGTMASKRSWTCLHWDKSEGPTVGTWQVWYEEGEKVSVDGLL